MRACYHTIAHRETAPLAPTLPTPLLGRPPSLSALSEPAVLSGNPSRNQFVRKLKLRLTDPDKPFCVLAAIRIRAADSRDDRGAPPTTEVGSAANHCPWDLPPADVAAAAFRFRRPRPRRSRNSGRSQP